MSCENLTADFEKLNQPDPPPSGINTIFFDMGLTLAGLRPSWEGVYHQVFQRAGLELNLDEVAEAVNFSWGIVADQDGTAEFITSHEGSLAWQREVEDRIMERLAIHPQVREEVFWSIIKAFEDPATYQLFPDTLPTLQKLKAAGYRLAIISNWGWRLPELCQALGITPYFEHIFSSARVGFAKPNRLIFQHALEKMEAQPDDALHIGDSFRADVVGAKSAGIEALWLVRPATRAAFEEDNIILDKHPNVRKIESLAEVMTFLGMRERAEG